MSLSDSESDDGLEGLSRPSFNTAADAGADSEDSGEDEPVGNTVTAPGAEGATEKAEDEAEGRGGALVGAEAAFELASAPDALELDPFRVAAGANVPDVEAAASGGKKGSGKTSQEIATRLFVGGLAPDVTEPQLLKAFARFGKVVEARVPVGESGRGRGFGFVEFVSTKGARFCLSEAGDPPRLELGLGRECSVRYVEKKDSHGAGVHGMPARGSVAYLGRDRLKPGRKAGGEASGAAADAGSREYGWNEPLEAPGVRAIAAAHRLNAPDDGGGGGSARDDGDDDVERPRKRGKAKKNEIVTISRRPDAEPVNERKITLKEIFPKEFWKI